jgi:hypothetical protein
VYRDAAELELDILGNLWFLKVVNAICAAYRANADMSARGSELLVPLLVKMESVRLDPTSDQSFLTFVRICDSESDGIYSSLLTHCYLTKFVLPEFELLRKMGRKHVMSLELLTAIGNMTIPLVNSLELRAVAAAGSTSTTASGTSVTASASSSSASSSSTSTASNSAVPNAVVEHNMILNRSIVELLYKAFMTPLYFREVSIVLNGILSSPDVGALRVLQMFLERVTIDISPAKFVKAENLEDISLCEDMQKVSSLEDLRNLFKIDVSDIRAQSGHNVVTHVAKAKVLLKRYAHELFAFLNNLRPNDTSGLPKLPVNLSPITRSILGAQIYTLTSLLHAGGKSSLVSYLRQPKPTVLPFGITAIDPKAAKIKMLDPFSMICSYKAYNSACNAIIQVNELIRAVLE